MTARSKCSGTPSRRAAVQALAPVDVPQTFEMVDLRVPDDVVDAAGHPLPVVDELSRPGRPVRAVRTPCCTPASSSKFVLCSWLVAAIWRLALRETIEQ